MVSGWKRVTAGAVVVLALGGCAITPHPDLICLPVQGVVICATPESWEKDVPGIFKAPSQTKPPLREGQVDT